MKRRTFLQTGVAGAALLAVPRLHATPAAHSATAMLATNDTGPQVINAGVGGNNTVDLLARIENDCLSLQPDLVVFMAGTNDMNSKKYVPLPQYEKNMRLMISSMQKINAVVVLMSLLPVYEPYLFTRHEPGFYAPEGHSGRLKQMNTAIQQLAMQHKLGFIDLYPVFKRVGNIGLEASSLIKNEANSKTTDGLHPTPDGYRLMAVAIHAALVCQGLANKKKIVCFGDSITKGDGVAGGENYPSYLQKLLS
ncbi:MAG TPA: GDSL-type esterase/lipase family protein [Chitinophagaceae bacterium]|nr:GDSL-type esterase/lipase family protein [Chitinophagaceae bacterium]